jgi:hypothetical protein
LECFFRTLPNHLKKGILTAMPALASKSSIAWMLFTSRLKNEMFCVASEETIDPTLDATLNASFAITQESRFLLSCCNGGDSRDSLPHLGDKSNLGVRIEGDACDSK